MLTLQEKIKRQKCGGKAGEKEDVLGDSTQRSRGLSQIFGSTQVVVVVSQHDTQMGGNTGGKKDQRGEFSRRGCKKCQGPPDKS